MPEGLEQAAERDLTAGRGGIAKEDTSAFAVLVH